MFWLARCSRVCNICIKPFGSSVICVMQIEVLFLSLSGSGRGNLSIYIKGVPAVLEGMGRLVCLTGFTNQCHLCSLISKFFVTFVSGWPGLAYNWYILFCYFCFFGTSSASQGLYSSSHLKINVSFLFTASSFS